MVPGWDSQLLYQKRISGVYTPRCILVRGYALILSSTRLTTLTPFFYLIYSLIERTYNLSARTTDILVRWLSLRTAYP
ncbi:hypothetical protein Pmar_PMAR007278, partial [Perkinsus marinus ATCC 50983]